MLFCLFFSFNKINNMDVISGKNHVKSHTRLSPARAVKTRMQTIQSSQRGIYPVMKIAGKRKSIHTLLIYKKIFIKSVYKI